MHILGAKSSSLKIPLRLVKVQLSSLLKFVDWKNTIYLQFKEDLIFLILAEDSFIYKFF